MADTPKYKLIYFHRRGVAELCRLVFKVAGVEFVDERYSLEEWPNHKEAQPLKSLPVLEVNGKKYCQSNAMARYLAREFGLMGETNEDGLRIDEIQETVTEMFKDFYPVYFEQDEAKKEGMVKKIVAETMPKFLEFYEMRLKENNDGQKWLLGDKFSLGDLILYNAFHASIQFLSKYGLNPLEARPILQGHYNRVESVPKVAAWIKERPVTEH